MNCRQFSKHMGDYVNRTVDISLLPVIETHIKTCPKCAEMISELESTSMMISSLNRAATPSGFDERLKARLIAQQESMNPLSAHNWLSDWIRAIYRSITAVPAYGRLVIIPVLAGIILLALILGTNMIPALNLRKNTDTDWVYIQTCRDAHASFASADPLADDSAAFLRAKTSVSDQELL